MLTGHDLDVDRDRVGRWHVLASFTNGLAEDVEEPPLLPGELWFRLGFGVALPLRVGDGFADGGETGILVSLFDPSSSLITSVVRTS